MRAVMDRREFLKIAGISVIAVTAGPGFAAERTGQDFMFAQMSDTHWGFSDPTLNADFKGTLQKAVASINRIASHLDFVVFTGDLTHTTDDGGERRKRMAEAKEIISGLKVRTVRFLPGEHDAALDNGEAFKEFFGRTRYTFDHKGVHFIALDNVSDPRGMVGDAQLSWLAKGLKKRDKDQPMVILTHRPLFDLYPQWDWATRDGSRVLELLKPFSSVTVFYGHIHQQHHSMTDGISHHAAKGLMWAFPPPGSMPQKTPIKWDPAKPYAGLGFRTAERKASEFRLTEYPVITEEAR